MPTSITIRFYEELNDFLRKPLRKKAFAHTYTGTPPLLDVIESLGIPHGEVDLILANGEPAGFDYKPSEGDYISVYPKFESLDIGPVSRLRPKPLRTVRFILDVHLGKLARHLRMLGFDTAYRNDYSDREIIDISLLEQRIILTRDIPLLKNGRVTHGYFVRATDPLGQAREVIGRFDLKSSARPFGLCMECNTALEKITAREAEPFIENGTRENYREFLRCPSCHRIYWEGSHFERMEKLVRSLLVSSTPPSKTDR